MVMSRIAVLGAMFFLVALSPRTDMALVVFASGISLYSALWAHDIFRRRR
jgi:hypothetical protein